MPPTNRNRPPNGGRRSERAVIRRFDANEGTLDAARQLFNAMESAAAPTTIGPTGKERSAPRIPSERRRITG